MSAVFDTTVKATLFHLMQDNQKQFAEFLCNKNHMSTNRDWQRMHIVNLLCMAKIISHLRDVSKINPPDLKIPNMFNSQLIYNTKNKNGLNFTNAYLKALTVALKNGSEYTEKDVPFLQLFLPPCIVESTRTPLANLPSWANQLLIPQKNDESRFMTMILPETPERFDRSDVLTSMSYYFKSLGLVQCAFFFVNDDTKQIFGYDINTINTFIRELQERDTGVTIVDDNQLIELPINKGPLDGTVFRVVSTVSTI